MGPTCVFEEHRTRLEQEPYADPEDPDEYRAENVFWVPPEEKRGNHTGLPTEYRDIPGFCRSVTMELL
jgi:hypothetical protein